MFNQKLIQADQLDHAIQLYKQNKQSIVFTNGCFDILHAGHIHYLYQAKTHGDILLIGLNSDQSVRQLKGNNRPINPQAARAAVLSGLEMVDGVVIFDEDTPIELIKKIKPNTHVKGGDYLAEKLPEYEIIKAYGGNVVIEAFLVGFSTSSIVDKD